MEDMYTLVKDFFSHDMDLMAILVRVLIGLL